MKKKCVVLFITKFSHLHGCTFETSSVHVNCQFSSSIKNSSLISTVGTVDCFFFFIIEEHTDFKMSFDDSV